MKELSLMGCSISDGTLLVRTICSPEFSENKKCFVNLRDNPFLTNQAAFMNALVEGASSVPKGLDLSNTGLNSSDILAALKTSLTIEQLVSQANKGTSI